MSARRRRWGRSTASQAKTSSSSDCATKSPSTGSSPAIAPESQISTTTAGGPRKAATPSTSSRARSRARTGDGGSGGRGGGSSEDRKRGGEGKSVSVRVDLGGRRMIKKKTKNQHNITPN